MPAGQFPDVRVQTPALESNYPPSVDVDRTADGDIEDEDEAAEEHAFLPSGIDMKVLRQPKARRQRPTAKQPINRSSVILATTFLSIALLVFLVIPAFLPQKSHYFVGMPVEQDAKFSNGTHDFRRTVLMVSIDGLRADYLDRGLTPHLLNISQQGLRAKYLKPVFPTLTFPNHWALMTGLYPESHGIVANQFFDPVSQKYFDYSKGVATHAPWWGGEPIWETASKAGLITANLMWPGPVTTSTGISPTYFVPWKNKVPLQVKHDQIMDWIDLPLDERPQLILAYEPSLDQAGHRAGPGSDLVNGVLKTVDEFAASIHHSLQSRNLTNIVDIVFVSDHGMTNTSNTRLVYLDDILGEHLQDIVHEDGWPSVGLRLAPTANSSLILSRLLNSPAATSTPPAIDVYTSKTMPARYHFNPMNNPRIAEIYVVPRLGWAITNHHQHEEVMLGDYRPKGNHGYDNDYPSMFAMFVADGPFATLAKQRKRALTKATLGLFPAETVPGWRRGELHVIDGFDNVEVYGLITKLLHIATFAAPNNGTTGFWDRYLDR